MKKLVMFGMVALLVGACTALYAASSVNQTVTYQVTAINEISVSGNPSALIVNSATAGSEPDAATDNGTTYAITTNESSKKITGAINTAMPSNTSLKVTLAAPTGGTSAGQVTLSTSAQDLVTGISTLAESGNTISYEFSATAAAGVVSSASKTVTLTVADGS
jgi:hypothetical protein